MTKGQNRNRKLNSNTTAVCFQKSEITGSAVALHCWKAHERINRKTGNSTHCKIVTPENFSSNVCTRDYVGDGNYCAIFMRIGSVGASPQIGEI